MELHIDYRKGTSVGDVVGERNVIVEWWWSGVGQRWPCVAIEISK